MYAHEAIHILSMSGEMHRRDDLFKRGYWHMNTNQGLFRLCTKTFHAQDQ